MSSLINIDLVPNFEDDDFAIIKNLIENPEKFDIQEAEKDVRKNLTFYFPNSEVYFFNSARSALTFLLTQISDDHNKYPNNDQIIHPNINQISDNHSGNKYFASVITQAFSCLVVPNAIKFADLKPVYVDIDESFNLDIDDLKRKINKETKAIIIQNTFGIPAKINEILTIAKENNLVIIENLTHSLGAKYQNVYLGNFGDVALLSFNRNKIISSIIGGALVINNKTLNEKIKESYKNLGELDNKEVQKILFTGKVLYQAKKNYNFLTKIYLKILRKKGLTLEMVSAKEKQSQKTKNYLAKFPQVLFPLLRNQLEKLEKLNEHRRKIAQLYITAGLKNFEINENSEAVFLRFPIFCDDPDEVLEKFKRQNIYLGDWYRCVLAPCEKIDLGNFDYQTGSCHQAELISKKILNLPTFIGVSENQALKIINLLIK